mgnify:CR=1 FL=1
MTAVQRKKFDTIICKLEALEAEMTNVEIRGRLKTTAIGLKETPMTKMQIAISLTIVSAVFGGTVLLEYMTR